MGGGEGWGWGVSGQVFPLNGYAALALMSELRSCVKVEVDVLSFPSIKVRTVSVELCESRGGRPGLSVLTSLLVSVDVKIYCTVLRHWSQLVPSMSHDI